jgi:hypothetical protein
LESSFSFDHCQLCGSGLGLAVEVGGKLVDGVKENLDSKNIKSLFFTESHAWLPYIWSWMSW